MKVKNLDIDVIAVSMMGLVALMGTIHGGSIGGILVLFSILCIFHEPIHAIAANHYKIPISEMKIGWRSHLEIEIDPKKYREISCVYAVGFDFDFILLMGCYIFALGSGEIGLTLLCLGLILFWTILQFKEEKSDLRNENYYLRLSKTPLEIP